MNAMSIPQALLIWHELEQCLRGENGFGSDTAEIYSFRLMPSVPRLEGGGLRKALEDESSFDHEDAIECVRQAKRDFCDICRLFERTTESEVRIVVSRFPDVTWSLDEWEAATGVLFVQRVHVRVERNGS